MMTGSPVLMFKPISSRKQKNIRKTISFGDTEQAQPDTHDTKNAAVYDLDSINHKTAVNETGHPLFVDSQDEFNPMASKSICSNSSSFAFPNRKGVKRKLNFDVDVGSDDVSSLRFSDKNISLYGLKSKTSSALDNVSLPEFHNVTLSPNKRRSRFSGSYSRSSVASVISCRRRLFTESEPPHKKAKLTSPDLSKKKTEVKLSLKKKFPGVPNSESARSGLLLNLAFSKYNLSNKKKDDVCVDFVDNSAVCTTTKKDFVHYSQIKKNETSLSRSPVFMAIKKVKRKLNLEDQDTNGVVNDVGDDESCVINDVAGGISMKETRLSSKNVELTGDSIGGLNESDLSGQNDVGVLSKSLHRNDRRADFKNFDCSNKSVATTTSFANVHLTNHRCDSLSFSCQKIDRKNNLFKNSKLRSTLRNKIYDLSHVKVDIQEKFAVKENVIADANQNSRFKSTFSSSNCNRYQKVIKDCDERNTNHTFKSIPYRKLPKKWISCDSSLEKSIKRRQAMVECDRKFLKSHMNRFLTDCLVSVEQKDQSRDIERSMPASQNERVSIIENGSAQSERFHIENVDSQTELEAILIENVQSQDEHARYSDYNDTSNKRCNDLLLISSLQNSTISIRLNDVLNRRKASKLDKGVNTENADQAHLSSSKQSEECNTVNDAKIAELATSSVSYSCVNFAKPEESTSASLQNQLIASSDLLDTERKIKTRKSTACSLTHRLNKLLNREKSDFHLWRYEISKTKRDDDINIESNTATFCIQKMWKEYSFVILQCTHFQQEITDLSRMLPDEFKSFANDVPQAVTIILEQDYCPKNLTYSTVFQVHPPWKLMYFEKCDVLFVLKPRKISVVCKDGNPALYRDSVSFNCATVTEQKTFCSCDNFDCSCLSPDCYQFLIEPLMISSHHLLQPRKLACLNCNDADSFNSSCIHDAMMKCKLVSTQHSNLHLRILHTHRSQMQNESPFCYVIGVDEKKSVCVVLLKGNVDIISSRSNEDAIFEFGGILPWKIVPFENVTSFMQFVHFNNIPEDIQQSIEFHSILIFTLSEKYGVVKYL